MKNPEMVLKNLFQHSQENKDYVFERLYRNLYNKEFYIKAYTQLYTSHGSATPETDGKTLDGFDDETIKELMEQLKSEQYQAKPAKKIYIPKKNGRLRPIAIQSKNDKIIQKIIEMILTAIYEPIFNTNSYGFRQNLGCHDALMHIKRRFVGSKWFIKGDIVSFFDNMDYHVLINILSKKIKDEKFIRLIWKFLKAGYMEQWRYNKSYSGTPQGGIISPILANIYLNEFDNYIDDIIKKINVGATKSQKISPEYNSISRKLKTTREKIKNAKTNNNITESKHLKFIEKELVNKQPEIKYHEHSRISAYKKIMYVRYADDFIIGVIGSREESLAIKEQIGKFLEEQLKLQLSIEKTLITDSSDKANFLGYEISTFKKPLIKRRIDKSNPHIVKGKTKFVKIGVKQRVGYGQIKLTMPKEVIPKKLIELKVIRDINERPWRATSRAILINNSDLEIIDTYNEQIEGLYNYYKLANNVSSQMNKFYQIMKWSFVHTLASKHKITLTETLTKFHYFSYGEDKDKTIRILYENKKGEKRVRKFYHKGFRRDEIIDKKIQPTVDNINTIWNTINNPKIPK